MRRSTDKNPETVATDAVRWPSVSFLLGGLKRQFLFASILTIPVFFLVIFGLSRFPLEYTSSIAVIFDTAESTEAGDNLAVVVNRISSAFESRFSDPHFFKRVLQRLPKDTTTMLPRSESPIKKFLQNILPLNLQPASWALTPEEQDHLARVEELKNSLEPSIAVGQYTLNLAASAPDPTDAHNMVSAAMAQFIADDLAQRREQALAKIDELRALEANVLKEKETAADLSQNPNGPPSIPTTEAERRIIKNKEQVLVREILLKIADFERAQSSQESKLLLLSDDMNNLLSRKGVTHPDVIQKQREIEKLKAEPVDAPIQAELNRLKSQLFALQRDMKARGLPIDRSVQIASFPDDVQRVLTDLTTQIRTLENMANELADDIEKPLDSRRFTIVRDPEVPSSPSNKKQLGLAAGVGLMLCLLTFGMTILIREMNQPHVVASEQMDRLYGVHPTAEVKPSWLRHHPVFDTEQIRELRPQLGQLVSKRRPELMLLDSYRHIGQLVDQMQEHQVTVVFDTGAENHPDNLAANLTKVLTVDSGRRALFLSFRGRDSHSEENSADLMEFLAGKAEWKNVRLKGSADGSHDTAYARDPLESLGAFKEDIVQRLFKSLREKYQVIVVEAFPPAFNSENGILHSLSDAVVLQIRLGETRHEDMQRLLQFMDRRKIAAALIS
ncbi:hypothetical protein [Oligoflexus tunisiensis]|uniref:hypothetical protein n=1 Tax=Oligoflexus tunisiensis TaxID=708132 RepID=UPI00114D0936|nr:hypothetical protein [Oligoflexus tunisiensis]